MLQFFPKAPRASVFSRGALPRLAYICHVDTKASQMPRMMHAHEGIAELLLLYEGAGFYHIGGKQHLARKGDLICYNSRVVHSEQPESPEGLGSYTIGIANLSLAGLPKDHILPAGLPPVVRTGHLFSSFFSLFQDIEREAHLHPETAAYLTAALVCKTVQALPPPECTRSRIEETLADRTLAYIDQNYREPLRLSDIARAVHADPYYLSHLFKTETGLSPMRYCILRRLGEAQNLLINTRQTVTSIAMQVGYNNSNYFQNVFKAALGITPKEYRKKWTG